jgi:hypothetical protein
MAFVLSCFQKAGFTPARWRTDNPPREEAR